MDGAGLERPFFWIFTDGSLVVIGNHDPFGKFFDGIRWPPSNDDRAEPVLIEDIPDRLGLAREIGDRANRAGERVRLGKSVDAMFVSALPGCNRGPEHWTKYGLEGGDVSANAFFDQPGEIRHLAGVDERHDDSPVCGVPTDQEHLSRSKVSAHGRDASQLRTIGETEGGGGQSSLSQTTYHCHLLV